MKVCNTCNRIYRSEDDFLQNTYCWRYGSDSNLYFSCSCGSTLMLKQGKFAWFSPKKLLSKDALNILNRLAIGDAIPKFSNAINKLLVLLDDPTCSINEIAKCVKDEPLILADIIKISNLLKNSFTKPIESIEHAIMYIGRRMLKELACAAAIRNFKFHSEAFNAETFWQESFVAASFGERICELLQRDKLANEAYLSTCLSNVGKVIYAICKPEMADKIHSYALNHRLSWLQAEVELQLPSHSILGEIATAFWGLPPFVLNACLMHHTKSTDHPRSRLDRTRNEFLAVVILADQIRHFALNANARYNQTLVADSLHVLKLKPDFLDTLKQDCDSIVSKVTEKLP